MNLTFGRNSKFSKMEKNKIVIALIIVIVGCKKATTKPWLKNPQLL